MCGLYGFLYYTEPSPSQEEKINALYNKFCRPVIQQCAGYAYAYQPCPPPKESHQDWLYKKYIEQNSLSSQIKEINKRLDRLDSLLEKRTCCKQQSAQSPEGL